MTVQNGWLTFDQMPDATFDHARARQHDCPYGPDRRALFWGRLHVSGGDRTWITDWKVLKVAYIGWTGSGWNQSPADPCNWWHHSDVPLRVERIEAKYWQPLPLGPNGEVSP